MPTCLLSEFVSYHVWKYRSNTITHSSHENSAVARSEDAGWSYRDRLVSRSSRVTCTGCSPCPCMALFSHPRRCNVNTPLHLNTVVPVVVNYYSKYIFNYNTKTTDVEHYQHIRTNASTSLTFMSSIASSHALMTIPVPTRKLNGLPRSREESNLMPSSPNPFSQPIINSNSNKSAPDTACRR